MRPPKPSIDALRRAAKRQSTRNPDFDAAGPTALALASLLFVFGATMAILFGGSWSRAILVALGAALSPLAFLLACIPTALVLAPFRSAQRSPLVTWQVLCGAGAWALYTTAWPHPLGGAVSAGVVLLVGVGGYFYNRARAGAAKREGLRAWGLGDEAIERALALPELPTEAARILDAALAEHLGIQDLLHHDLASEGVLAERVGDLSAELVTELLRRARLADRLQHLEPLSHLVERLREAHQALARYAVRELPAPELEQTLSRVSIVESSPGTVDVTSS